MARLHPNVLKLRKQRHKERRAYLNQFNRIHVPRSGSLNDIPEDQRGYFLRNVVIPKPGHVKFVSALMPHIEAGLISRTAAMEYQAELTQEIADAEERELARATMKGNPYVLGSAEEVALIGLIEDPDVCDYITLRTSPMQRKRLTMVYNRQYTRVFFIEVHYRVDHEQGGVARKSNVYGSRERAIFDYEHKRIKWMEVLELSTLRLVFPETR